MILVDANLLAYAHVETFPQHAAAKAWLEDVLGGPDRVGLPWSSLVSFTRLVSSQRLFSKPAPPAEAWKIVDRWLASPVAWTPTETAEHGDIVARLLPQTISPQQVACAHLAALAISHDLTLMTTDPDFSRFKGLRWADPLGGLE